MKKIFLQNQIKIVDHWDTIFLSENQLIFILYYTFCKELYAHNKEINIKT